MTARHGISRGHGRGDQADLADRTARSTAVSSPPAKFPQSARRNAVADPVRLRGAAARSFSHHARHRADAEGANPPGHPWQLAGGVRPESRRAGVARRALAPERPASPVGWVLGTTVRACTADDAAPRVPNGPRHAARRRPARPDPGDPP